MAISFPFMTASSLQDTGDLLIYNRTVTLTTTVTSVPFVSVKLFYANNWSPIGYS
jgi:hypothetical protein